MFDKYLKYKMKYLELNDSNYLVGGGNKKNLLYLFKADWCGHCKNFKSTWNKLKEELNKDIEFITYDSNKDSNIIKEFNIQGYPTIILKKKNKAIEYMGNRNINDIKEFINKYK